MPAARKADGSVRGLLRDVVGSCACADRHSRVVPGSTTCPTHRCAPCPSAPKSTCGAGSCGPPVVVGRISSSTPRTSVNRTAPAGRRPLSRSADPVSFGRSALLSRWRRASRTARGAACLSSSATLSSAQTRLAGTVAARGSHADESARGSRSSFRDVAARSTERAGCADGAQPWRGRLRRRLRGVW